MPITMTLNITVFSALTARQLPMKLPENVVPRQVLAVASTEFVG